MLFSRRAKNQHRHHQHRLLRVGRPIDTVHFVRALSISISYVVFKRCGLQFPFALRCCWCWCFCGWSIWQCTSKHFQEKHVNVQIDLVYSAHDLKLFFSHGFSFDFIDVWAYSRCFHATFILWPQVLLGSTARMSWSNTTVRLMVNGALVSKQPVLSGRCLCVVQ